ncbi:MAG: pyridoxamine 5'-phosphate oxidase family protein [Bdellovibrionota bacterium]
MTDISLKSIAEKMKDIDVCMMTTVTTRGSTSSRPMSNNREVEYDGTSYFFAEVDSLVATDIKNNDHVTLSAQHNKMLGADTYISVSGKGKVITDRAEMEKHWNKDVEIYFADGLDSPNIAMIEVKAEHIKLWEGAKESELTLH